MALRHASRRRRRRWDQNLRLLNDLTRVPQEQSPVLPLQTPQSMRPWWYRFLHVQKSNSWKQSSLSANGILTNLKQQPAVFCIITQLEWLTFNSLAQQHRARQDEYCNYLKKKKGLRLSRFSAQNLRLTRGNHFPLHLGLKWALLPVSFLFEWPWEMLASPLQVTPCTVYNERPWQTSFPLNYFWCIWTCTCY